MAPKGRIPFLLTRLTISRPIQTSDGKTFIPLSHYLAGSAEGKDRWDAYSMFVKLFLAEGVTTGPRGSQLYYTPVFSILMPVYNAPEKWLRRAIESVLDQIYPTGNCVSPMIVQRQIMFEKILEEFSSKDDRICVTYREQSGHIAAASNTALNMATGDFVTLLDHETNLKILHYLKTPPLLNDHPDADMSTAMKTRSTRTVCVTTRFSNRTGHPTPLVTNVFKSSQRLPEGPDQTVGGFRTGYDGSQDYDLALRFRKKLTGFIIFRRFSTTGARVMTPRHPTPGQGIAHPPRERH
ncbi:MAG: hypothetical protein Ct9H300mP16_08910 [Pseudomonadota bacterium]|nr:MAG: hypothetical protein Ct9H300mP16_08910 [Pseudomonadota bacterium]